MQILFYTAVLGVFILAFKPLKEASAYRFRHMGLVIEGSSYAFLGLAAIYTGSWIPILLALVLAFILYKRRSG